MMMVWSLEQFGVLQVLQVNFKNNDNDPIIFHNSLQNDPLIPEVHMTKKKQSDPIFMGTKLRNVSFDSVWCR